MEPLICGARHSKFDKNLDKTFRLPLLEKFPSLLLKVIFIPIVDMRYECIK